MNAGVEMEFGRREIKLTAKACANEIEKLQYDWKILVTKMKGLNTGNENAHEREGKCLTCVGAVEEFNSTV